MGKKMIQFDNVADYNHAKRYFDVKGAKVYNEYSWNEDEPPVLFVIPTQNTVFWYASARDAMSVYGDNIEWFGFHEYIEEIYERV